MMHVRWAAGVERLALLLDESLVGLPARPVFVFTSSSMTASPGRGNALAAVTYAMRVAHMLREHGFTVVERLHYDWEAEDKEQNGEVEGSGGKLKKELKRANKAGAFAALFVGNEEVGADCVTLRALDCGRQERVSLNLLPGQLHHLLSINQ